MILTLMGSFVNGLLLADSPVGESSALTFESCISHVSLYDEL